VRNKEIISNSYFYSSGSHKDHTVLTESSRYFIAAAIWTGSLISHSLMEFYRSNVNTLL